ncbi:MAG: hypothetical protein GY756_24560 [bacterium]|nr:hypothetical protein [bacterium]
MNDCVKYEYHHMGIPTDKNREGERYSPVFKMYSSNSPDSKFHVEWHRFEEGSSLPELVKTIPHVAFKVENMEKALEGMNIIFGPYYPFEGFCVAMVEDGGAPVEFIQTDFTEEEIWNLPSKKGSYLYPEEK